MQIFDDFYKEEVQYKEEVRARWGDTDAYREYTEKTKGRGKDKWNALADRMNEIFAEFARCMKMGVSPDSAEALALVRRLQNHITENYYTCTPQILSGLGQMYVADERFRKNIDKNGAGTAAFAAEAIRFYAENV